MSTFTALRECVACKVSYTSRNLKYCSKNCQDLKHTNIAKYLISPNVCLYCNQNILPNKTDTGYSVSLKKFCNHSCSALFNNKNKRIYEIRTCIREQCNNVVPSGKANFKYCCLNCSKEGTYENNLMKWRSGAMPPWQHAAPSWIRRYLISKIGNQCSRCAWKEVNPTTGRVPIEVEHIDGNWKNINEENLTLLCPNCHSLSATFRGANRGMGRPSRNNSWRSQK